MKFKSLPLSVTVAMGIARTCNTRGVDHSPTTMSPIAITMTRTVARRVSSGTDPMVQSDTTGMVWSPTWATPSKPNRLRTVAAALACSRRRDSMADARTQRPAVT
ncbi:hypothetical protein ACCO45_012932 [Purpureocillium lilacinum]|uniref:Uncharacterized protein n=1 Tax=Purpureocillium lilacinum TaxID=33203 RepID=A0ACC4DAY7_PURLI